MREKKNQKKKKRSARKSGALPVTAQARAQLALRHGDLGLRSAARHVPAAYWASWADSLRAVALRDAAYAAALLLSQAGPHAARVFVGRGLQRHGLPHALAWSSSGRVRAPGHHASGHRQTPGYRMGHRMRQDRGERANLLRMLPRHCADYSREHDRPITWNAESRVSDPMYERMPVPKAPPPEAGFRLQGSIECLMESYGPVTSVCGRFLSA